MAETRGFKFSSLANEGGMCLQSGVHTTHTPVTSFHTDTNANAIKATRLNTQTEIMSSKPNALSIP